MKRIIAILLVLMLCLSFAACGDTTNGDNKVSQPATSPTEPVETPTEPANAPAEDVKQLSGKVTVYMPSPAGLADKIAAGFKASTGVEVEVFQGTTGEILARLEAEEANPIADVVILASWSDGLGMKASDKLMSYTPANADKIVEGWIDADSTLFGYSASAVGVIYNTTIIPELSADWGELAGEKYKDTLAIPDPEKSGACKDFVAGFVNQYGWEAFEGMAANGKLTLDNDTFENTVKSMFFRQWTSWYCTKN